MKIQASNREELFRELKAAIPTVSPRGLGRSKEETEPWVTHRLLPTLAECGLLDFPLTAEVRLPPEDRPDVYISSATAEIGIEVIEAVLEWLAQAHAIRNKQYPNAVVSQFMFPKGYTPTVREIHEKLALGGQISPEPPWHGDSVEQDWAERVDYAIAKKVKARAKPGFKQYDRNWLAIYSSLRGPALKLDKGFKLVQGWQSALKDGCFDRLYLLTDLKMLIVDRSGSRTVNLYVIEPDA
jgi:hypothetical protein